MSLVPPRPSSAAVSAVMRGNRGRDTRPEKALRSALHRDGLRFRYARQICAGKVRVRPDVVFPAKRVAVFVDGCYWHRCPDHGTTPKTNAEYWAAKLDRNVARDRRVDEALRSDGWRVVRIWEHESIDAAVALVTQALS